MSVKYSWSRQNGAAVPPVRFMSIEPAEDYYKGMPLKLKEKGIVEPTDGDPEYICMAEYNPDAEIQPLEIPVQEVFPDVVYDRMNEDGTTEEVRFGSKGGGGGDLLETVEGVVELAFDGTLEGKEYKEISADGIVGYLVKMSDDIPAIDDLIYYHVAAPQEDHIGEVTEDVIEDGSVTGIIGYTVGRSILVITEPCEAQGVLLSPGIWFSAMDGSIFGGTGWIGGLGLTYQSTKTQLKPSLLPNHKHKWDDIEDAICYDRSVSAPLNITFDGDLTGKEVVQIPGANGIVVKVSDVKLTIDQLLGSTVIYELNGEETSLIANEENTADAGSEGLPAIMIDEFILYVYGDTSAFGVNLTEGLWVAYDEGYMFVKSISNPNATITTGEIKKIDNKFIDAEWMATTTEVKGDVPFLEGTISGSGTMNGTPDVVLNVGEKYLVIWDGVEYVCNAKDYGELFGGSPGDAIGIGDLMIIAGQGGAGEPFFIFYSEDAIDHFTIAAAVEGEHTFAVYEVVEGTTPLPPKFMPELTQVILISPGGKKFKTTVDDTGQLVTTEV